jgi:hypothetical protein
MNEITRTNLQNITYMDIRELRLGNWVLDHEGEPKQVAYVGETIGLHLEQGGTQKYQHNPILSGDILDLKPIPLTSEILEKVGFEFHQPDSIFKTGVYRKWNDLNLVALIPSFKSFSLQGQPTARASSVHQLQNLYFVLTGTELKINL